MVVVVVPAHKAKVQLIKVTTTKVAAEPAAAAEAATEAEAENCLTKLRPCGLCIVCKRVCVCVSDCDSLCACVCMSHLQLNDKERQAERGARIQAQNSRAAKMPA